jgi:hypothetical protein
MKEIYPAEYSTLFQQFKDQLTCPVTGCDNKLVSNGVGGKNSQLRLKCKPSSKTESQQQQIHTHSLNKFSDFFLSQGFKLMSGSKPNNGEVAKQKVIVSALKKPDNTARKNKENITDSNYSQTENSSQLSFKQSSGSAGAAVSHDLKQANEIEFPYKCHAKPRTRFINNNSLNDQSSKRLSNGDEKEASYSLGHNYSFKSRGTELQIIRNQDYSQTSRQEDEDGKVVKKSLNQLVVKQIKNPSKEHSKLFNSPCFGGPLPNKFEDTTKEQWHLSDKQLPQNRKTHDEGSETNSDPQPNVQRSQHTTMKCDTGNEKVLTVGLETSESISKTLLDIDYFEFKSIGQAIQHIVKLQDHISSQNRMIKDLNKRTKHSELQAPQKIDNGARLDSIDHKVNMIEES